MHFISYHLYLLQGIKYLNHIYSIYVKREVDQKLVDAEIYHWLKLLLLLVDIKSENAPVYIDMFLKPQEKGQLPDDHEPAISKYRHISLEYVSESCK